MARHFTGSALVPAAAMVAAFGLGTTAANAQEAARPAPPVVYSVVNVREISDPGTFYNQYVPGHLQSIRDYGGSFIVATPEEQTIEGDRDVGVTVIHQWPSRQVFYDWYESEAYRPRRKLRHSASQADVVLVDGVATAAPSIDEPAGITVVDVVVTDPEVFRGQYVPGHMPSVEQYGGRFLVAGGAYEVIEGTWEPSTLVIHQFPSAARFLEWYGSDEYAPWREIRHSASHADVTLTDALTEAVKAERGMP